MKMTYWIAEHTDGSPARTLRFSTREAFDRYVRNHKLESYTRRFYDLPREIIVEADEILAIITHCLDREDHQTLPWEKK